MSALLTQFVLSFVQTRPLLVHVISES